MGFDLLDRGNSSLSSFFFSLKELGRERGEEEESLKDLSERKSI